MLLHTIVAADVISLSVFRVNKVIIVYWNKKITVLWDIEDILILSFCVKPSFPHGQGQWAKWDWLKAKNLFQEGDLKGGIARIACRLALITQSDWLFWVTPFWEMTTNLTSQDARIRTNQEAWISNCSLTCFHMPLLQSQASPQIYCGTSGISVLGTVVGVYDSSSSGVCLV